MNTKIRLMINVSSLIMLTACVKEPAEQYRLSNEQLAWQGYKAGEVIRFGNSSNMSVRTYTITSVQDQMEEQYISPGALPLPSKEFPQCQHLTVEVQRTDSSAMVATALELKLGQSSNGIILHARAGWDKFYSYARLPLDEVNCSTPQ